MYQLLKLMVAVSPLFLLSGCANQAKYKIKVGLGTYYTDSYSSSIGCTSFKYYIGGALIGTKETCEHATITKLK